MLLLDSVHVQVVNPGVLTDDHSLIHVIARGDEKCAAFLKVRDRESVRLAASVSDERTRRACPHLASPWLPTVKDAVKHRGTARLREELGPKSDQAPGWCEVIHPRPASTMINHLLQAALTKREHLRDHANVLLW